MIAAGRCHAAHALAAVSGLPTPEKTPKTVTYLGKVLPTRMWGLLIVHCFHGRPLFRLASMVPELIAAGTVVGLHVWKRNMSLSMIGGTPVYMLIRTVFV